jgi:magnesium-transporting ATPase (P-type)
MLWMGAVLCISASSITAEDAPVENLWLSTALVCVIIITGIFLYYRESKSSRIIELFKNMVPWYATVICGSQLHYKSVEDVVVGDVVEVRLGVTSRGIFESLRPMGSKSQS